jgi:hypothetical protein
MITRDSSPNKNRKMGAFDYDERPTYEQRDHYRTPDISLNKEKYLLGTSRNASHLTSKEDFEDRRPLT